MNDYMGCAVHPPHVQGKVGQTKAWQYWFEEVEPHMQRHLKALGTSKIRRMHPCKQCNIKKLLLLHNTMNKK